VRKRKKVLLAIFVLMFVLPSARALAQVVTYRTEVCVNASNEAAAKRLFPNADFHIIPDFVDSAMNGWRVTATARANNMSDVEEISLRLRQNDRERRGE
jgi:hypothetical protein